MEIRKVTSAKGTTQVTIDMTDAEAKSFMEAFTNGRLTDLGITSASISRLDDVKSPNSDWTAAESDRRTPTSDDESTQRRR